ncbi:MULTISPECIES: hypothetical protein [unclassified Bacteroides]|jgi:hypothetical protein|uniref:hypothetical protein n=1 Tax=unclassified Bacteroides TaxID=2646097 RepID=UPI000E86C768|nr:MULTISPECIES: hypothetical protein [unclassified Bacteroides]RGN50054.1 hypothetical protein DXB63_05970 [Bacteroides sp. OM05-12]RHR75136.1 hypothetical protein DWW69_10920 [Bacteroides sp. AF16-49]DAU20773.1 MAG TPA: hypothetical protein [Caudoviricetes sp.]
MNDETEAYHLADIEESRDDYDSINYSYQYKRCRVKELSNSQEAPKRRNEKAKVGTECRCPMCGKKFVKKVYQQKFCCIKCKNNYHNKRQVYY